MTRTLIALAAGIAALSPLPASAAKMHPATSILLVGLFTEDNCPRYTVNWELVDHAIRYANKTPEWVRRDPEQRRLLHENKRTFESAMIEDTCAFFAETFPSLVVERP